MIPTIASHLPVLARLVKHGDRVLEFGCGIASTPFLLSKCSAVVSIEMQSREWFEYVSGLFADNPRSERHYAEGATRALSYIEALARLSRRFDVVLVDGHGDSRPEQVRMATMITDVIVCHDTQEPGYRWDKVRPLLGWTWTDEDTGTARTSVIQRAAK